MHIIQQRLLELAGKTNLTTLKLRKIGELINEPHPQKVKHHLNQLFKKGHLKLDKNKAIVPISISNNENNLFIPLPILGSANCGQALRIADEYHEGYLFLSKSLLFNYKPEDCFVVKAVGDSMNDAKIKNKSIEEGDYAIICKQPKGLSDYNKKYVLSIINGMANIKKLLIDNLNEQILLLSESKQDYPPIYIHNNDYENYLINGEVVDVIKKPTTA